MNENEQRFRNKVTIVSFWLAVFVVYIHANNTTTYKFDLTNSFDWFVYRLENWAQGWQQVGVPTFFIISAFLFFRNYQPVKLINKLKSRFFSLVIPYLIWNLVPWMALIFVQKFPFAVNISTKAELSIDSFIGHVINCDYSVLWYVRNLIVYVLLTPIIYLVATKKKIGLGIPIMIAAVNIIFIKVKGYTNSLVYWVPFYLFGAWLACNHPDWFTRKASKRVTGIALIIVAILVMEAVFPGIVLFNETGRYVFRIMIPMSFWYAVDLFDFTKKPQWIMCLSFPIYCTHAIILDLFEKIILVFGGNNTRIALISYLFLPLIVLTIIFIIMFLGNEYCPKLYGIAFGNRGEKRKN